VPCVDYIGYVLWLYDVPVQEWWDMRCQDTVSLVTRWTSLHAWNLPEKVGLFRDDPKPFVLQASSEVWVLWRRFVFV